MDPATAPCTAPADVPSIPEGAKDQVQVIQKQLLQCFTPHCIGMSANQMQNQTVLFQVLILELPNNKACIAVDGTPLKPATTRTRTHVFGYCVYPRIDLAGVVTM